MIFELMQITFFTVINSLKLQSSVVRVFRDKDWTIINDLHPFAKDWSKHQIKIFGDKFGDGNMGTVISPV
jgi:hypothetical protein